MANVLGMVTPRGSSESSATRHASGYRGLAGGAINDLSKAQLPHLDLPEIPLVHGLGKLMTSIPAQQPVPANMVYLRVSQAFLNRRMPRQVVVMRK